MKRLTIGMRGEEVLELQRALAKHGFLTNPDGVFGNHTASAVQAFQISRGLEPDRVVGPLTWAKLRSSIAEPERIIGEVDARSEKVIAALHPRLHPLARQYVRAAAEMGIEVKLISGLRTYEQQTALYNQPWDGIDNNGNGKVDEAAERVTKAPAGYSNHNFGLAWDSGIFQGTKYIPESPLYKKLGGLGKDLGLEWGGDWKSIVDEPHLQLRPDWARKMTESAMLAELRRRKSKGIDAFA